MTLKEFFQKHNKVALGFSGGVDSSYLLYAGMKYGADIKPYYVKGEFQPAFELRDALRLAEAVGASTKLSIIETNVLNAPCVAENNEKRCYYCKCSTFGAIVNAASKDGYTTIIDGTNASDDINDRPGFLALQEMEVLSPLRLADLTKDRIRELSREAGLFTWNKPSYSCLATRIPTGTRLTEDMLYRVEEAEREMFFMGYSDFRVRVAGDMARIQLKAEQMEKAIIERERILELLSPYFKDVCLDLKCR